MSINVKIIQHSDYLEFIVSGSFDPDDALNHFPYVLDSCSITRLDKVLIDFYRVQGDRGSIERYLYASFITKQYQKYIEAGGKKLKFAYVGPTPSPSPHGIETIDQKIMPVKVFEDRNEALKWLAAAGK